MKLVITPKKRLLKWLNNSKLSSKDGHDYYECYIYIYAIVGSQSCCAIYKKYVECFANFFEVRLLQT